MTKEKPLNKHEKTILRVLAQHRRPMSIKEIADKAGISWVTARKYLIKLEKEGVILSREGK